MAQPTPNDCVQDPALVLQTVPWGQQCVLSLQQVALGMGQHPKPWVISQQVCPSLQKNSLSGQKDFSKLCDTIEKSKPTEIDAWIPNTRGIKMNFMDWVMVKED